MGFMSWIIPQEKRFFDMIEDQSKNVLEGVDLLIDMLEKYENLEEKRKKIKQTEEVGDAWVQNIVKELNKTFITPIDREDISKLACSLDDILDNLEAVSERLVLYKVKKPPKYMIEFAQTLHKASKNIHEAISLLRDLKEADKIRICCAEVNALEKEGDRLLRKAMVDLFNGNDAVEIIKMKELYDDLEAAIDRCEDVADVIGDILVKYT
jgi:hypothetical protein